MYPPAATSSTPDGDSVTATKFAVDRQVEHGKIASTAFWSLVRIDQTCLGRSGGFAPISLPLFHGTRVWGAGSHSLDPAWSDGTEQRSPFHP